MKKKFTMLFAALLAFVGVAKADVTDLPQISTVENPIYYTIYNTRSSQPGGLMYYAGDNVGLKDGCTSLTLENKYKFFFTGTHEAMYIHNAATGKKLASVDSWTDAGIEWTVSAPTSNGLAFGPKGENGNVFWNDKNYGTNENTSDFTVWSATDAGSIFVVELAENFVAPISELFYVIEAPLFEKVQGVKKALYVNEEGNAVWGTEDLTNHNFYWIPTVKADGTIALKNFGAEKYLSNATGAMSGEAVFGNLNALGCNSFNINFSGTIHANNHSNGQGANGNLVSWGGVIGSASAWTFVQKNDPTALAEVDFEYSFVYEGVEQYTQKCKTLVGEEYPVITVAFPFGVSAVKPEGEVTADINGKKVTIDLSVNLPFTYNDDSYYYIKNKGEFYLHYDSELTYIPLTNEEKTIDATNKDAYSWRFEGDPFSGFYIANKLEGVNEEALYLYAPTSVADGTDGAEAYVVVKKQSDNTEGYHHTLFLTASTHQENGFFIAVENHSNFRWNNRGSKLAYWTGGADLGSTFTVELRDDAAALQALVDDAEANLAAWNQTGVGYVTVSAEHKTAISEAVAAAKTAIANKTGYDAAEVALKAAVDAAQPYTIQPEANKFYTLVSSCTDDHRGGQEVYVNIEGGMQFAKVGEVASEIARVFQFVPAADGKFYLYNVENGVYMQSVGTATEIDVTKAKPVTITNLGAANIVKIVPDGQNMMHTQDSGSKIVGWNNNSTTNGSAWTIVEKEVNLAEALTHTLTVSEAGWATLVLGYNTTIPTGVKAYAVSSIAEGKAVLTEVENVLPAHTPVLIEAAKGEYAFNYTADEATVASNLLAGSVFNIEVEGDGYVLAAKGENVGLYKAILNEGKFTNKANKAYLPAPAEGNAPAMFVFSRGGEDEDTTGIDQLINANGEVVIYDLAGRRVEKMEKGIYIVNGKKVIR